MSLSQLQTSVVNYVESHYWEFQTVPTQEKLEEVFGYNPLEDPLVQDALHRKYLWTYYTTSETGLTQPQLLALNMMCNPADKRSKRSKLNSCSVTVQQWQTWMNDPNFYRHFAGRIERNFRNQAPEVMQSVVDSALGGDVRAQTLYLELTGRYQKTSSLNVNVDFNREIDRLIEIIQRHVSQEQLMRIAGDFERELSTPQQQMPSKVIELEQAGFSF